LHLYIIRLLLFAKKFRAGIHNDRGFDNHFRESAAGDGVGGG
jgi:hypothetical protein